MKNAMSRMAGPNCIMREAGGSFIREHAGEECWNTAGTHPLPPLTKAVSHTVNIACLTIGCKDDGASVCNWFTRPPPPSPPHPHPSMTFKHQVWWAGVVRSHGLQRKPRTLTHLCACSTQPKPPLQVLLFRDALV